MNNYAISQQDISEILQRSASSMKSANNTLEETIALGTGAQEIVQNSQMVGTALRTTSLRIRGVGKDMEDLSELTPKLEKKFKSIGLTLKEDDDTFKSTYEIMKDLSGVWEDLTDMQQADILELVAGKRQSNTISAILSNFDSVEQSLESAKNSAGSAQAEFERAMDSIEFKANRLSQTMTRFWQKFINREVIKDFVDGLNIIAKTLDFLINNPLTSFALQVGSLAGVLLLAKKGLLAFNGSLLATKIGVYALDFSIKNLTASLTALAATPTFWIIAGAAAIVGGIKLMDALTVSVAEQREKVKELHDEYKSLETQLDNLNSELDDTNERIDELSSKDQLTLVEEDELEELQLVTEELEYQIGLLEKKTEHTAEKLGEESIELYDKLFDRVIYIGNIFDRGEKALDSDIYDVESLRVYREELTNAQQQFKDGLIDLSEEEQEKIKKTISDIDEKLVEASLELMSIRDKILKMPDATEKQKKKLDEINDSLRNMKGIIFTPDELFSQAWTQLDKEQKEQLKTAVKNKELTKEQAQEYDALNDILDVNSFTFEKLTAYIENETVALEDNKDTVDDSVISFEDLTKKMDDTINSLSDLSSAYSTLQKDEKLSHKTLSQLIRQYPTVAEYIAKTNDVTLDRGKILEKVYTYEINTTKKLLNQKKEALKAEKRHNLGLLSSSSMDSQTYQSVQNNIELIGSQLEVVNAEINALDSADISFDGSKTSASSRNANTTKALADRYLELNNAIQDVNNELDILNEKMKNASDEEKAKLLARQNKLYKQQQDNIHALADAQRQERAELEKSLSNQGFIFSGQGDDRMITNLDHIEGKTKDVEEAFKRYIDIQQKDIPSLQKEWWDLENAINGNQSALEDLTKEAKSAREEIANDLVDTVKKAYEQQKDLAIKALNQELKTAEDVHEKKIKLLDEELSKYQDIINAKLESIDREENTDNYEKQLAEMQEERAGVLSDINLWSMDDSLEARNKLTELNQELADVDEKIEEHKHKRQVDLRKQNLNDQLDAFQKETTSKKQKLNDELTLERDRIETEISMEEWKYDELINDVERYEGLKQDIIEGNLSEVQTLLNTFIDDFGTYNEETIKNLDLSWQTLKNNIYDVKNAIGSVSKEQFPTLGLVTDDTMVEVNQGIKGNSVMESVASVEKRQKKRFDEATTQEAKDRIRKETEMATGRPAPFAKGGYTGKWFGNEGKLALLHPEEFILNKKTVSNMLTGDLFDILPKINMPQFKSKNKNETGVINVGSLVSINGNIESNIDMDLVVDKAISKLSKLEKKNLNLQGIYRTI